MPPEVPFDDAIQLLYGLSALIAPVVGSVVGEHDGDLAIPPQS